MELTIEDHKVRVRDRNSSDRGAGERKSIWAGEIRECVRYKLRSECMEKREGNPKGQWFECAVSQIQQLALSGGKIRLAKGSKIEKRT